MKILLVFGFILFVLWAYWDTRRASLQGRWRQQKTTAPVLFSTESVEDDLEAMWERDDV